MITKINNYRSFVDYAFKTCDSFSLVFHNSVYPLQMADFEIFTENKKVSEVVKEIVEKYETL
jgi:hypothetical protein